MSPTAPLAAVKDAPKTSPAPAKKKTTEVDRLRGRLDYLETLADKFEKIAAGHHEAGKTGDHAAALRSLLTLATETKGGIVDLKKALFKLKEAKWTPVGGRVFAPGEEVGVKDWYVEKLTRHGAYPKKEVERLRVVSVHGGKDAKVQTLKGEALGLLPCGVLVKL